MKHKKLFISLTAILSVIVFFAIFLMIWFFGDTYRDFQSFRQEFEIPGLDEGAIPQGMGSCAANYEVEEDGKSVTKTQQYFFVSAYMKDGSPSRIYVIGEQTGYVGFVELKNPDGSYFYGHCGGVAINNTISTVTTSSAKNYTLWVTGEGNVYVAKPSAAYITAKKTIAQEIIEKAARKRVDAIDNPVEYDFSVQFTNSFKANCNASFCFYYDDPYRSGVTYDRLYVGEFYREGNYETDKKHWLTTPNGYQNTAFMYEYNVSTSTDFGLIALSDTADETPAPRIYAVYSLPEKIQGVAFSGRTGENSSFTGSTLILSESYGLKNSHLMCFDFAKVRETANRATFKNATGENFLYDGVLKKAGSGSVPYTDTSSSFYVYYVDKANSEMYLKDYSIPSMSEGMCVITPTGDKNAACYRVHVLFESACDKYKTFVRQPLKNVYSFIPNFN